MTQLAYGVVSGGAGAPGPALPRDPTDDWRDSDQTPEQFRAAADRGDAAAQTGLGVMYCIRLPGPYGLRSVLKE